METGKEKFDLLTNKQKSVKMGCKSLNPTAHVIVNFIILCMVGGPILLFALLGEPRQRGFYCSDDSLMYPLLESTISTTVLIAGGVLIPTVVMVIVELLRNLPLNYDAVIVCNKRLPSRLAAILSSVGYFLFGCACIQIITDVTKYSIGRLRPHFHDACKTDWNSVTCNTNNHSVYIQSFTCLNLDHHVVRDARLSFFSGHASFSAFTMIYLIIYLERRVSWRHPVLIKPLIQFLFLLLTIYTSISRVFDYHHHWSDVLFGFSAGTIMALLFAHYVSGLVHTEVSKEKDIEMSLNL